MDDENPTVREDQGYLSPGNGKVLTSPKYRKQNASETSAGRQLLPTELVKVEYIKGICAGRTVIADRRYVQHVIDRGFAREVRG